MYVNSVLANLNARSIVVETMAPQVVDRGPFGSGQNPFEKHRKQSTTVTSSSGAGPSSHDRAQARIHSFVSQRASSLSFFASSLRLLTLS